MPLKGTRMINPNLSTPLYIQLGSVLEQAIVNGQYKPGDKLPSENELCKMYGVSRITVRQALGLLLQKKQVYSAHGKGTFVQTPAIVQELGKIRRFGSTLNEKGLTGYTRVFTYNPSADSQTASSKLNSEVCSLDLIGYVQETPAVYYQSFIRRELGEKIYRAAQELEQTRTAFSSFDLYDKLGILLQRIDQTIRAINADASLREIFRLRGADALMVLESVYYSSDGVPLEFKTGYYRSDIYTFNIRREL